jgi:Tfp pilus assembly protein PilX
MAAAPRRAHRCDERGAALVVTLVALLVMGGLLATYLAVSALEPQISRNHVDLIRARYLAEAGIEHAYDTLVSNAGAWNQYLVGATCAAGVALAEATLPERTRADGHFTVLLRNDCATADQRITGVPPDDTGNPTRDANGKIIAVSTGFFRHTTHTITAVISDDRPIRDSGQSVPRAEIRTYNWSDH